MSHLLAAITPIPIPQDLTFNRVLFGVVAVLHIQLATFIIGGANLALISEAIAVARRDERHTRLAHGLITALVKLFAFGGALPILWLIVILVGFWGTFFVALTKITFWIFILEAGFFLVEGILLYGVYSNWERLARHRNARLGLLVLLCVSLFWQQFLIDVVASFMLTPNGGDLNQLDQVLNPTNLPLTLHRTLGNIAWAGALVAAFAAIRLRRAVRHGESVAQPAGAIPGTGAPATRSVGAMSATWFRDDATAPSSETARPGTRPGDRAYYDFVMHWGLLFTVGFTLFQPWVGYSYAKEVQLHAYAAWYTMMFGDLSNVFLLQITLLGLIFVLGALFFWRRIVASGAPGARSARNAFLFLCVVTTFAAVPSRFAWTYSDIDVHTQAKPFWEGGLLNPIGNFIPNKVIALILMMLGALWALVVYLKAVSREQLRWGEGTRRGGRIAVAMAVTVSSMMAVMGVIREHSRQPFLIYGELTIAGQRTVNASPPQVGPAYAQPQPAPPSQTAPPLPSPGTSSGPSANP